MKKLKLTSTNPDSIQLLSLSLFMLLLAFFIVLSTTIDFNPEKFDKLKQGIMAAFMDGLPKPEDELAVVVDKTGEEIEATFNELEDAIRLKIGVLSLQKMNEGNAMVVTVDAEELFNAPDTVLASIARIISNAQSNKVRYELEVLSGSSSLVSDIPADQLDVMNKKLGKFSRTMTTHGIEKHRMSVGIIKAKSGKVDLIFYARRNDKPFIKVKPTEINRGFGGGTEVGTGGTAQ